MLCGELGEADAAAGYAAYRDAGKVEIHLEVGGADLEPVGGELLGLLDQFLGGLANRRAALLQAA